jgi:tetrahydromethanopterin S-methyltransferase subunit A
MKNIEKKFMTESDEYQLRVLKVVDAIFTLNKIDEIKSFTLQIKEEDTKLKSYVEFIIESMNNEEEEPQEEDSSTKDTESDILTENIKEVKELMSILMSEVKNIKERMDYTEKAVVKLIKESR